MNRIKEIKREYFDEIASTQEYCKQKMGEGQNLFVVAKRQTKGHGTKGRSFSSEDGGLYFSMLLHPEGLLASEAFTVMARTATAVCKSLEALGLSPKIKWPNDIHLDGKKVCGILIENRLQGKYLSASLIGVGVNINNTLPKELSEIACSVCQTLGRQVELAQVEGLFKEFFFEDFSFEEYSSRLGYIGEDIRLTVGERTENALLLGVSEQGVLRVQVGGEAREYGAGEVTVRR